MEYLKVCIELNGNPSNCFQDISLDCHIIWMTFYLFVFCCFFFSSIFPQSHLSSHFRSCMLLLPHCVAGLWVCMAHCVCVCVCVCTRIKPTSILRGSRGKKAPLRPLGKGIPLEWVPHVQPIETEAVDLLEILWWRGTRLGCSLTPSYVHLFVFVCFSVTCLCDITALGAAAVVCLWMYMWLYSICVVWIYVGTHRSLFSHFWVWMCKC